VAGKAHLGAPRWPRRATAAALLGLAICATLWLTSRAAPEDPRRLGGGGVLIRGGAGPSGGTGGSGGNGEIEFQATLAAFRFNHDLFMPGYHAVVWRGGRAAGPALLRAEVTDVEVLDALEGLGVRPGNALGMESWDRRKDPRSTAPDQVIAGTPVEILVRLPGQEPQPLAGLLSDTGGRGLEMRFGGHRANIPLWHSGCIVCLYSCPGSKVGNARYTVRDYVRDTTRFRARTERLPPDGTKVGVILRLTAAAAR
jgi:hypothetical protein